MGLGFLTVVVLIGIVIILYRFSKSSSKGAEVPEKPIDFEKSIKYTIINITNGQYCDYLLYKEKIARIKKKEEKIEARGACALTFMLFFVSAILFNKVLTNNSFSVVWNIVIIFSSFVMLCYFPVTFLVSRPLMKLFNVLIRQIIRPPRKDFYDVIEQHEKHIADTERAYPGIKSFNYDKSLYFNHVFRKIIEEEIVQANEILQKKNKRREKEYWLSLNGYQFEEKVAELYREQGYRVHVTKKSGDGGIDINLWDKKGDYIIIQCKNHKSKIGISTIRELYGVMHKVKAKRAILICSGGFNPNVYRFARGESIALMDINDVISLSCQNSCAAKLIKTSTQSYCFNEGLTLNFAQVGDFLILRMASRRSVYNATSGFVHFVGDQSDYLGNDKTGYCLFDSAKDAEAYVSIISALKNKPIPDAFQCNIASHKIDDEVCHYKTMYYIKLYPKQSSL